MVYVSIVEDDDKTRRSLEALLGGTVGCHLEGGYASAEQALSDVKVNDPHVFVVDIGLAKGRLDGVDFVRNLSTKHPHVGILMLTVFDSNERIFSALTAGAHGYILKSSAPSDIVEAVLMVGKGGSPMSPMIARKVVQHFHGSRMTKNRGEELDLSERELCVLDCLTRGSSNKSICEKLSISPHTVHAHLRSIYRKLHVHSRAEAVVAVFKSRLV